MPIPTPGLVLDYLPLPGGEARLVRAYSGLPCIALPETLPGPDGGRPCALTELGSYCFSETLRDGLPAGVCRCVLDEDGNALPCSAGPQELHPVAGRFIEEITLPDSLRLIGNCAFYNCRSLRRLEAGSGALVVGSDVFLNCFALTELIIRAEPTQPTGLFALVNNITSSIRAVFCPNAASGLAAAFWYPEYWEDIEETPAHILLHTFSGQGYHYRQCFLNGRILSAEYDAAFAAGHDADDQTVVSLLCLDRLRYPFQLGEEAQKGYRTFLSAHTGLAIKRLLAEQDLDGLRTLLALDLMDAAAFAEGAALANKANNAEAAALLADAEYRCRPAKKPARRYSFDF